eukprot:5825116-Karenia_brevis.AAC.1
MGEIGVLSLYDLMLDIIAHGLTPWNFNDRTLWVPKEVDVTFELGVAVDVEDVRPIPRKDTDNKAIAGVLNEVCEPIVQASSCSLQKGSAKGGRVTDNI